MTSDNLDLEARAFALFERSLKQDGKKRRKWIVEQAGVDTELRSKTLALLSSDESGPDILLTGAAVAESYVDETPPERIGVYKIGDKLGQGGMGSVYRGIRDVGDFDHTVAIKLIKPGIISDNLKDRFAHEQQVLAGFSHPNIAHLYDGGTTQEGAPYIIMELIDGVSITDWVRQNNLDEKQCLEIFKTACQAVAYAHQNLIIHRDLTPSNVLVTKAGVVKLIDFGIAKPYDEDAAAQDPAGSLASLSFTPGFAAPERSKGSAANTRSDIYSLGKLLEDVLPEGTNDDLQAIYDKATALKPEDRYASVDALIDDLDNYLGGYPVNARQGGTSYKIRKFIKRNNMATVLGSLTLAGLIGSLVVTTSLFHKAEAARRDADERFTEVRELANFMLFDLYDQLKTVPGNTKSLSSIADKSKIYLDTLSNNKDASTDLKLETAIGYKRLSDVMGNPITTNLGRRKETKELLDKAYRDLEQLLANNPDSDTIKRALAEAAYSYAVYAFIAEDNNADTVKYSNRSEGLYREIIESGNADIEDYVGRLRASLQGAKTYYWDGRGAEGIRVLKSLAIQSEKFADEHPGIDSVNLANAAILTETALTMSSHYYVSGGDASEALPYINKAITIYKDMIQTKPKDLKPRRNLVGVFYKRALIYSSLEKYELMLDDLNESDAIASQFLLKDRDDRGMLRIALAVRGLKSKTLAELHRYEEASLLGEQILIQISNAYKKEPDSAGRAREYANAQANLAIILALDGQKKKACLYYQKTLETWDKINAHWGISDFDRKDAVEKAEQFMATCP